MSFSLSMKLQKNANSEWNLEYEISKKNMTCIKIWFQESRNVWLTVTCIACIRNLYGMLAIIQNLSLIHDIQLLHNTQTYSIKVPFRKIYGLVLDLYMYYMYIWIQLNTTNHACVILWISNLLGGCKNNLIKIRSFKLSCFDMSAT